MGAVNRQANGEGRRRPPRPKAAFVRFRFRPTLYPSSSSGRSHVRWRPAAWYSRLGSCYVTIGSAAPPAAPATAPPALGCVWTVVTCGWDGW